MGTVNTKWLAEVRGRAQIALPSLVVETGKFFIKIPAMAAVFRISLLGILLILWACASRDDARQQSGLPSTPELESHIPGSTPGPGYERIQKRPDATPTPRPTNPMDKPLDPIGMPQE